MAPHSNTLAWKIPPLDGGAWSAAVHGVARSCTRLSDFTFTFHFHAYWRSKWQPTPVFLPGEFYGQYGYGEEEHFCYQRMSVNKYMRIILLEEYHQAAFIHE